jgi:hypothetical protein
MSLSRAILGRFDAPDVGEIDNWRRAQAEIPSRADALRTLVRLGLAATKRSATRERKKADTDTVE